MQDLFDTAEHLLVQPVWTDLQEVRTLVAQLLTRTEELILGEHAEDDAPVIAEAQRLAAALLPKFKNEQRRQQLDATGTVRQQWHELPDPVQQLIRGTPVSHETPRLAPQGPGTRPRTYADLFGPPSRSRWAPGEYLSIISEGVYDPRLVPMAAGMGEGIPGAGGFMVPVEVEYRLMDVPLHTSIVLPRAEIIPMTTRTKLVPGYDGRDQSSTLYGFTFSWLRENEDTTPGTGTVRAIELTARPGGIYLAASNEIIADTTDFEANLEGRLQVAIGEVLDYHYLNGTGAAEPLGVLQSTALIVVTKEGSQSADTILWANITKIFSRHSSPTTAVWVCSPSCLTQLLTLTTTGNAGSSLPAVIQGADGSLSMLGRPLLPSHKLPVLGDRGDIGLYDFSAYFVGLRQGMALERSAHAGFTKNQMVYRMIMRLDGMPKLNTPITGKDSQTYSPFVTIEARS